MAVKRLDTSQFDAAIDQLNNAVSVFRSALASINSQTVQLQSSWDGKGADKFDKAYKRLKQEFDDQADTLEAIRDDLISMKATYTEWDTDASAKIAENNME